jgi:ketosteroid isomerase-like protein
MGALFPQTRFEVKRTSGRGRDTVCCVQPRDVLLAVNAAFSRRDPQAMVERFAPDAAVTDHRQGGLGCWRGRDELLAYYAGICDSAHELREDLTIVAEHDGVLVADCMFHARLTEDGPAEEFSLPYGLVVVVRDGLIQELGVHQDAAAATQAASMPETS